LLCSVHCQFVMYAPLIISASQLSHSWFNFVCWHLLALLVNSVHDVSINGDSCHKPLYLVTLFVKVHLGRRALHEANFLSCRPTSLAEGGWLDGRIEFTINYRTWRDWVAASICLPSVWEGFQACRFSVHAPSSASRPHSVSCVPQSFQPHLLHESPHAAHPSCKYW